MPIMHFPPELIDERPWLGVLLGLTCIAAFSALSYSAAQDCLNYFRQRDPEVVNLKQGKVEDSSTRRWVTLTNFQLDCDTVIQTTRTELPDVWILGSVLNTYIILPDHSGAIPMIVKFDGDVTCSNVQNGPLTGVLTNTNDRMYGGIPEDFGKTPRLVLYVGQGIKQSALLLILGFILILLGLQVVVLSGRKWIQTRDNLDSFELKLAE